MKGHLHIHLHSINKDREWITHTCWMLSTLKVVTHCYIITIWSFFSVLVNYYLLLFCLFKPRIVWCHFEIEYHCYYLSFGLRFLVRMTGPWNDWLIEPSWLLSLKITTTTINNLCRFRKQTRLFRIIINYNHYHYKQFG